MARHASGEKNYRVAKGPFIAVLAVIVLVGAIVLWVNLRSDNQEAIDADRAQCKNGDLTLVVTSDPAAVGSAQKLVQAYGESNPVVKDFCVKPQITVAGSQEVVGALTGAGGANGAGQNPGENPGLMTPGVWIPADISFVDQAKGSEKVKVNDPKVWLSPIKSGVAFKSDRAEELKNASWAELAGLQVATPGGSDAALSSVVSAKMGGGPDAARGRAELGQQYTSNTLMTMLGQDAAGFDGVAATQPMLDMAGEGLKLVSPADSPELHAPVVTFGSGGAIDENVARAAEDFRDFAAQHGADGQAAESSFSPEVSENFGVLSQLKTDSFALPPELEGPDAQQPATPVGSAILVADTADGIDVPALSQSVTAAIDAAPGGRYGLWAMAPEATQLVGLPGAEGDNGAEATKTALGQLPVGGGAQLWPALIDAFRAARDAYAPDKPNRIVVLTSGKDTSGADAADAVKQIQDLIDPVRPVSIEVIVLPDGDSNNSELQDVANMTNGALRIAADYGEGLASQLAAAIGRG
ncbi:MAG: hypothetical protein Q4E11_00240 [Corynebacterium sp.]|uniref:hypothetical protein n=1 Tax=Corynebacterium sp. TaxID=1720 RepID=UPI0026DB69C0|nr:hypothetical protein [Corynebacterium sp.]MDO5029001.1 hypothetical protein [Corynebacterium sp.]